ncbi:MAG: hypothetical protein LBI02_04320 [Opitutaceae bacterium]|jgi:23S rRNA pseudouridine1911/1915/1917 synthase|nr:hypothetical protein [Opitutaceae bacterium]
MPDTTITHTLPPGTRRIRADKALANAFPEHSRAALQRAFDAGLVTLDNRPIHRDHAVRGGDTLALAMPPPAPRRSNPPPSRSTSSLKTPTSSPSTKPPA